MKRIPALCVVAALSLLAASASGARWRWPEPPWSWSEADSISRGGLEARSGLAAAAIGGSVYAVGGSDEFKMLGTVRWYDPGEGVWREASPMPTRRSHLALVSYGGLLYAIGGRGDSGPVGAVEAYDPATKRWSPRAAMPTPRHGLSAATVGGIIVAVGGRSASGLTAKVEAYDPVKDVWSQRADLPVPVETRASAVSLDGILYLLGGRGEASCLRQVQAYNPATDAWAAQAGLPTTECYLSAIRVGDAVFGFGDSLRKETETNSAVVLFYPKTGQAKSLPYNVPYMTDFAAAAAGGRIYLMGGKFDGSPRTPLRLYDPSIFVPTAPVEDIPPPAVASTPRAPETPRDAVSSDVDRHQGKKAQRHDDFALVVGVQHYRAVPEAQFAARDAETFGRYARTVLGVPKENVIVLVDEKASRADFTKYLEEWLPRNVRPQSRVYFYFSGHGAPDSAGRDTYLVPWDGELAYLKSKAYSISRLYASLDALPAKEVIVMLDACFSGQGPRSLVAKGLRPLVVAKQTPVPKGRKLTVLTAASGEEVAGTLEEQGHGMFTYFLLDGLRGKAGVGGHLAVGDLHRYLQRKVPAAARRQNREQSPQLFSGDERLRLY